jgi:hypothetical protein
VSEPALATNKAERDPGLYKLFIDAARRSNAAYELAGKALRDDGPGLSLSRMSRLLFKEGDLHGGAD